MCADPPNRTNVLVKDCTEVTKMKGQNGKIKAKLIKKKKNKLSLNIYAQPKSHPASQTVVTEILKKVPWELLTSAEEYPEEYCSKSISSSL